MPTTGFSDDNEKLNVGFVSTHEAEPCEEHPEPETFAEDDNAPQNGDSSENTNEHIMHVGPVILDEALDGVDQHLREVRRAGPEGVG